MWISRLGFGRLRVSVALKKHPLQTQQQSKQYRPYWLLLYPQALFFMADTAQH
jgi:hypothetical protein